MDKERTEEVAIVVIALIFFSVFIIGALGGFKTNQSDGSTIEVQGQVL